MAQWLHLYPSSALYLYQDFHSQFSADKSYIIKNADDDLKITLTDDSGSVGNEKILLENTNGTDNAAITLTSSAGGITATCDDDKSIILQNEANDT